MPFNRPTEVGTESAYVAEAFANAHLSGDGPFTHRCQQWLADRSSVPDALLTPSCTAALDMSAILTDVGPGDEVIMPSFTFVSTANAFVLRGASPVFVDVKPGTLNIDEERVAEAVTERTKAIACVHYGGVPCAMDAIGAIAEDHGLFVVEDAAQALLSSYRGRPAGSLGDLAALSFHETKNVTCGEGGALLLNDQRLIERAAVIRDKGTNRRQFDRGEVSRYTWVDIGSSFLLGEANAAFLWAQLEHAEEITERRRAIWRRYHEAFEELERRELVQRAVVPDECRHNGHLFHLILREAAWRAPVLARALEAGVHAVFHYVPLHSAPAGRRFGRVAGALPMTDQAGERLFRLPLWPDMANEDVEHVIATVIDAIVAVGAGARVRAPAP
ncbi:MAG: dTDP-4-amino-4,6-dideoxygalactose transaminase [Solirubrobacteraceae bacterium]